MRELNLIYNQAGKYTYALCLGEWFETISKDWSIIAVHPKDDLIILKKYA